MSSYFDDLIYLLILLCSFLISFLLQRIQSAQIRCLLGAVFGVSLVTIVCGGQILYSLCMVMANIAIIKFAPQKQMSVISFICTFVYLTIVRCAPFLGLPKVLPHANAVQLIMTLRCVGLAFEISDSLHKAEAKRETSVVDRSVLPSETQILDLVCYLYNFAGLFTGPYYTYRVHLDSIHRPTHRSIPVAHELAPRLAAVPGFVVVLLIVSNIFPLQAVHTEAFYSEHNILSRLLYMIPVYVHLRMRVYIAWMLAESTCIANGIGAYPIQSEPKIGRGPTKHYTKPECSNQSQTDHESINQSQTDHESTNQSQTDHESINQSQTDHESTNQSQTDHESINHNTEYSFETVRNIDVYNCEFSDGFRSGMRAWNRSVQYWLATCVYQRCPNNIRLPITMLVSAYWHGIHPGYYLSFLTMPLCTYAEDLLFRHYKIRDSPSLSFVWWLFRCQGIAFMATGFLLLSWESTIRYWTSIAFALHLCCLTIIGLVKLGFTPRNVDTVKKHS